MTMKTCLASLACLFIFIAVMYHYIMSATPLTPSGLSLKNTEQVNNHVFFKQDEINKFES